jgi:hypothetical protein
MAISISTKPKLQTRKEAAQHKRQKRKEEYFQSRAEIDQQLKDIEDERNIAESIEAGEKTGRLSAQEIIEAHEEFHGKILGPKQRKFVVANLIAKHTLGYGRMAGANNYNDDIFNYILERMMQGESLRHICRDPYMPAKSVFFAWIADRPDLQDRYARAREILKEVKEDDIQYHATTPMMTPVITLNPDGTSSITLVDNLQRSKLIVDSLKWELAKMDPAKYGTTVGAGVGADGNVQVEVTGGLPTNPLGSAPVFKDDPEYALLNAPSSITATPHSMGSDIEGAHLATQATDSSPETAVENVGVAKNYVGGLPDEPLGEQMSVEQHNG